MAKILILEDEAPVMEFLKSIITGMGHEVVGSNNGRDGLELVRITKADVIVSDLHMPEEPNGMALIRMVRALQPQCPIVIVSGYPTTEVMAEAEQLGITDFLTKPFEIPFVRSVLSRMLANKSAAPSRPSTSPK